MIAVEKLILGGLLALVLAFPVLAGAPAIPPPAPFSPLDGMPGVLNYGPQQLPVWRTARANIMSPTGTGRTAILVIGDSQSFGFGNAGHLTAAAWPYLLCKELANAGLPANCQSRMADGNYGSAIATYDPRVSIGSWTAGGGYTVPGGSTFHAAAATATPLSFTPSGSVDTCVTFAQTNFTGSFNINLDGGASTLFSQTYAYPYESMSLTGTLGTHTCNATWASGTSAVVGWLAYNSTVRSVDVLNAAAGGWYTATWTGIWPATGGLQSFLQRSGPSFSLCIILIGGNDWVFSQPVATAQANYGSLITQCKAAGADVLSILSSISDPLAVGLSVATMQSYLNAYIATAKQNNVPVIDPNYRGITYGPGMVAALTSVDGVHITNLGQADLAHIVARALLDY